MKKTPGEIDRGVRENSRLILFNCSETFDKGWILYDFLIFHQVMV